MSRDVVRLFGQMVILYCKTTCLKSIVLIVQKAALRKFKRYLSDFEQCLSQRALISNSDLISNSRYRLPYSSCDVSLEHLVLDPLIIP